MSEKSARSPKDSPTPATGPAPSVRRISNPRPKKAVKTAAKPAEHAAEMAEVISAPDRPSTPKFPEFPDAPEAVETPSSRSDWPEPEAASSGASSSPDGPKRKRRRKKGKGGAVQNAAPHGENENLSQAVDAPTEAPAPQSRPQAPRPNQTPHSKPDAELLAKCAWKIYLAEISEEGVALVGDNDAKELSRRCFRLAEIFLEEQARRR
jgi:hypothetical protein